MNVTIGLTVLLIVVVGMILAVAGEFKNGGVAKSAITLVILSAICGFVATVASGS